MVCKEQLRTEKTVVQILSVYFLEFYSKIKYTQRAKNIMNSHADHHYQHFSRSVFFLLFNWKHSDPNPGTLNKSVNWK